MASVPHFTDGEIEAKSVQLPRKNILNPVNTTRKTRRGFSHGAGRLQQASPRLDKPSHNPEGHQPPFSWLHDHQISQFGFLGPDNKKGISTKGLTKKTKCHHKRLRCLSVSLFGLSLFPLTPLINNGTSDKQVSRPAKLESQAFDCGDLPSWWGQSRYILSNYNL